MLIERKIATLFLILQFLSCAKEKAEKVIYPSIYNFKVIDYYSGAPVSNAKCVLEQITWPDHHEYEVIGNTNSLGEFQYNCDLYTFMDGSNYQYYHLFFVNNNCPITQSIGKTNEISVYTSGKTIDTTLKLFQASYINRSIVRNSIDPGGYGINFKGIRVGTNYGWGTYSYTNFNKYYYYDTLNQMHDTCFCVPSNYAISIRSYILNTLNAYELLNSADTVITGYNQNIYLNLEY